MTSWKTVLDAASQRLRWRDVEEYLGGADDEPLDEVPEQPFSLKRRHLLELMGASVALASCARQPFENIMPYVDAPPETHPGIPAFYASSAVRDGYATGILVETHVGRPTKIEGHPRHPMSLGRASAWQQALILELYDPARAQEVRRRQRPGTPTGFHDAFALLRNDLRARAGEGLHLVLPPTSAPSVAFLLQRLRDEMPRASVHFVSSAPRANAWRGADRAFGRALDVVADLSAARHVVCLDADIFTDAPDSVRLAYDWAARRRTDADARLFAADDGASLAFMNADVRVRISPARVPLIARALARAVIHGSADAGAVRGSGAADVDDLERAFVDAAARALAAGPGVVLVGDRQPPEVHAAAHAIHAALGAFRGHSPVVRLVRPAVLEAGAPTHDPDLLFEALEAGAVDVLATLDVNLAYAFPARAHLLGRPREHIHAALLADETAPSSSWFLPLAHTLESWGDARALDGTISIVQPAVKPLYGSQSLPEILARFAGVDVSDPRELVGRVIREQGAAVDDTLRLGFLPGTSTPPYASTQGAAEILARIATGAGSTATPSASATPAAGRVPAGETGTEKTLALSVRTDLRMHTGELCNVSWLLELPDPITKLTWENAALVSPRTAAALDVTDGDLVDLVRNDTHLAAPVIVQPGVADDVVVVHTGWGRQVEAPLARGKGFSAWRLASFGELGATVGVHKRGARRELARTQSHHRVRSEVAVAVSQRDLASAKPPRALKKPTLTTLYEPPRQRGVQWGMSIDLDRCTGCSACVVACMAENNVPVVGRDGVLLRREMHWLRLDIYFEGDVESPKPIFQPMLCQHCETAPCEYVCPVNATVHSADGLNEMIYNRCVGTRFCSNNCPYKVRRFNWYNFNRDKSPVEKLAMNPDVTVRARGVMEKCTYCVQRIRKAVIDSDVEHRDIADGEVTPACAQTCPTDAIAFGRIDDPSSRVSALRDDRRAYSALGEENTRPRTRYLARVRRGDDR